MNRTLPDKDRKAGLYFRFPLRCGNQTATGWWEVQYADECCLQGPLWLQLCVSPTSTCLEVTSCLAVTWSDLLPWVEKMQFWENTLLLRAFQSSELLCFIHKWLIWRAFRSQDGQVCGLKMSQRIFFSPSASCHWNFYPLVSHTSSWAHPYPHGLGYHNMMGRDRGMMETPSENNNPDMHQNRWPCPFIQLGTVSILNQYLPLPTLPWPVPLS